MSAPKQTEGVLVVGAGGHGKVVVATLQAAGVAVAGVLDNAPDVSTVLGVPVLGPVSLLADHAGGAVLGIGSNAVRQRIAEAYPAVAWLAVIHPCACVHESADVRTGAVVFAGAVVQPGATIGAHAIVNTAATVDHDGRVGAFAHLAPGVHLSGDVRIEEGALMGVGACVAPGASVGAWSVVGAGGVVVRDVPAGVTAVGVPARPRGA